MSRPRALAIRSVAAALLGLSIACGPGIDVAKAVQVTDVLSGWYDAGIVDGKNKLVPELVLTLHNAGNRSVSTMFLTVAFWQDGADGELDSVMVKAIGSEELKAGASSKSITVRSTTGYTLEEPRAALFEHSQFKDFTAKLFAQLGGQRPVPIGSYKIERRIIPHDVGQ